MHYFSRTFGFLLLLLAILVGVVALPVLAQPTPVITIGIDQFQQNQLNDEAFAAFEEEFGVDVVTVVIPQDARFFGTPQDASDPDAIAEYLANVEGYATRADLMPLQLFNSPQLLIRSGAFLDLTPLLNADADANLDDFDPAALESFQFDGGTWGLPMSLSAEVIIYNRTAFDNAGLAYPDETWTLDDFFNAGRTLSEFNNEGELTLPGFFAFDARVFHYLENDQQRLVDDSTFPPSPDFSSPALVPMIESWIDYRADYYPDFSSGSNFNFNAIPLGLNTTFLLSEDSNFGDLPEDADFEGALLPGGRGSLSVQGGYGVSGGTANPELAYELLQYMTRTPEIAFSFFGDTVARRSIRDAEVDTFIFRPELSEESQALIDTAIANAIPESDLSYYNYIDSIIFEASEDDTIDIATALEEKQQAVIELLVAIDEATSTTTIAVATPIPTPVLQSGEIALTFGAESSFGSGSDPEVWNATIDEFVAQDADVGQIIFTSEFMSLNERIETQDCFYLGRNIVPSADLTQLLSVDPFLSTDPNLDPANFIPNTLDQLTRDGATWGIPLSLTPNAIWYNRALFEEAGLPEPSNEWTMSEFIDTLNALAAVTDGAPFRSQSFGGQHIYQLIAAYGGQPIDYSTSPHTFQLEDPVTVEAIRQVLDLAKDGLIDYTELATNSFGGGGGANPAMFDSFLTTNDFRLQNRESGFSDQRVAMFPRGVDTIPVAYQLGSGYISAFSPAPEACYRWLSFLSTRPELLSGMPAQSDLFSIATENITEGDDIAAFYQSFNEALSSPNVVVLPIGTGNGSEDPAVSATNFITRNWINGAFDDYVLEDADLQTALSQAQAFRDDYAVCAESIPEPVMPLEEMSDDESQAYFRQFFQCAVDVDPSATEIYSFILESGDDE